MQLKRGLQKSQVEFELNEIAIRRWSARHKLQRLPTNHPALVWDGFRQRTELILPATRTSKLHASLEISRSVCKTMHGQGRSVAEPPPLLPPRALSAYINGVCSHHSLGRNVAT